MATASRRRHCTPNFSRSLSQKYRSSSIPRDLRWQTFRRHSKKPLLTVREQNLFASAKLLYAYTGDDPAAEVLVNVMLSMLDFELFAKTMREMAAVRPKSIFAQVALRS